jgi:hypothetical protein
MKEGTIDNSAAAASTGTGPLLTRNRWWDDHKTTEMDQRFSSLECFPFWTRRHVEMAFAKRNSN